MIKGLKLLNYSIVGLGATLLAILPYKISSATKRESIISEIERCIDKNRNGFDNSELDTLYARAGIERHQIRFRITNEPGGYKISSIIPLPTNSELERVLSNSPECPKQE